MAGLRTLFGRMNQAILSGLAALVLVIVPPGTRLEPGVMQDEPGRFHVLEIGKIEAQLAKLK